MQEAEQLYRHTLVIRRGERGATATNIHLLGALLLEQGRIQEAEESMERALATHSKVRGNFHPEAQATLQLLTKKLVFESENVVFGKLTGP